MIRMWLRFWIVHQSLQKQSELIQQRLQSADQVLSIGWGVVALDRDSGNTMLLPAHDRDLDSKFIVEPVLDVQHIALLNLKTIEQYLLLIITTFD